MLSRLVSMPIGYLPVRLVCGWHYGLGTPSRVSRLGGGIFGFCIGGVLPVSKHRVFQKSRANNSSEYPSGVVIPQPVHRTFHPAWFNVSGLPPQNGHAFNSMAFSVTSSLPRMDLATLPSLVKYTASLALIFSLAVKYWTMLLRPRLQWPVSADRVAVGRRASAPHFVRE